MGDDIFFDKLLIHTKAHEEIQEIPRRQRFAGRPPLSKLLSRGETTDEEVRKAVMEHGYSQKEVSEFLGVHYSTISRRVNKPASARKKT